MRTQDVIEILERIRHEYREPAWFARQQALTQAIEILKRAEDCTKPVTLVGRVNHGSADVGSP